MIVKPKEKYSEIRVSLIRSGLFSPEESGDIPGNTWRIGAAPYYLSQKEVDFFTQLGSHLLKFYTVLNQFYFDSVKGKIPTWFAEYLDFGKPPEIVEYGRIKRFKRDLPGIIRPDVIVTESGFAVTELDSVPGGFGLTAKLMTLYKEKGRKIIGEEEGGIPGLFMQMAEWVAAKKGCAVAILVSDEAQDYRSEMDYLSQSLLEMGFPVYTVHPREILFREEGLFILDGTQEVKVDLVYRFFELFDLKNIPKSELIMYGNKKGQVRTTPPYKSCLEEKLGFALFHHPTLKPLWEKELGHETFDTLSHLIPKTWILDNRELPPYGVIPGLLVKGAPVREWRELYPLTQKERELVIKRSGFSSLSWGSRGVVMGHDVSSEDWIETLEKSLADFPQHPSVLQEFHKGRRVSASFIDSQTESIIEMECRVRLTPYYFIVEGSAKLGGILATLCPENKKKIHGMTQAIMVPCALSEQ